MYKCIINKINKLCKSSKILSVIFEKVEYCLTLHLPYMHGSPIMAHVSLYQLKSPYKHKISFSYSTPCTLIYQRNKCIGIKLPKHPRFKQKSRENLPCCLHTGAIIWNNQLLFFFIVPMLYATTSLLCRIFTTVSQ